ncbi:PAS domain-containing protein [Aureimonas sp. SA4125]|uniref:PAS domain-containing protein n=1 Tax=Aureimonas sp. SA4125 TaxID=2826993 RepID=UPI001CC80F93|nr:PAS domain-containing protein [Aureimonas sp. SA4125]
MPEQWPETLKAMVATMLSSPHPMFMAWGPALISFFNDAYRPLLGAKAEGALGRPFADLWSDIWTEIEPIVGKALAGEGSRFEDMPLVMTRNGRPEDTWWSFSYMPLRDGSGEVRGVLCVLEETTARVRSVRHSAAERERLEQMFDQAPSFIALLRGPEHVFEVVNPAYMRLIGHRDVIGRTVAEALPEAVEQGFVGLLDNVFRTGEVFTLTGARFDVQAVPGGSFAERYVDLVYQPIRDEAGNVAGIFVEGSDVTDRTNAQAELREREQFLQSVLASSNDCIKVLDLDAELVFMNEGGKAIMEVSDFNAIAGCPWPDFWAGAGNADATAAIKAAKEGRASSFQGFADTMGGNRRFWDVQVTPIVDASGSPNRILAVSRDISFMKRAEEERTAVSQEMAHRMKNSMAMVQAVVTQSLRHASSIQEAGRLASERIQALSRAQDMLTKSDWEVSQIRDVVEAATAAHADGPERFSFDGPSVSISAQQSLGLSLAVHELATNATKYGALSVDEGRVSISWTHGPSGEFGFSWSERGGPAVKVPTRHGFGSRLTERVVPAYFDGTGGTEYLSGGVRYVLGGKLTSDNDRPDRG